MNLVQILVYLIVVGVAMYVVNNVLPLVSWMKTVINAVVAIVVLLWLLRVFGFNVPFPRLR